MTAWSCHSNPNSSFKKRKIIWKGNKNEKRKQENVKSTSFVLDNRRLQSIIEEWGNTEEKSQIIYSDD